MSRDGSQRRLVRSLLDRERQDDHSWTTPADRQQNHHHLDVPTEPARRRAPCHHVVACEVVLTGPRANLHRPWVRRQPCCCHSSPPWWTLRWRRAVYRTSSSPLFRRSCADDHADVYAIWRPLLPICSWAAMKQTSILLRFDSRTWHADSSKTAKVALVLLRLRRSQTFV